MSKRATFLLAIALTFSACSRSKPSGNGSAPKTPSETPVSLRLDGEPDVLNPIISTSPVSNYVVVAPSGSMVFETLLRDDPQTGRPTLPGLATQYPEISADHLVYTFTLRDGVKWHDGHPFSTDDVLFTMKAAMLSSVDAAAFRSAFSSLANVETIGTNQIRFRMNKPYWLNDSALGRDIVPLPKHVYDPNGILDRYTFAQLRNTKPDASLEKFAESFNKNMANRMPVGTGPYKLDAWRTGQELVLVRNEGYWGQKPHLDKIVYKIIVDATTALTALKSGDVDFIPRLLPVQSQDQTDGAAFKEHFSKGSYQIPQVAYIAWNESKPFFADRKVRQALTMLVDRAKIIETVRRGMGIPAATPFSPGSPDFDSNISPWPYDPERAYKLLDEAGWVDHNGNGVRDKNGVEFKFEILASSSNSIAQPVMQILQYEFGKAGISVTGRQLELAVYQSTIRDQKADATIGNWTTSLLFDPYQLFDSESSRNRGSNYFNFRNAEADTLMEKARVEFDPERRKDLYRRFQEIFNEEQPCTLLFYPSETAAYNVRLKNVNFLHQRPGYDVAQWSINPGTNVMAAQK